MAPKSEWEIAGESSLLNISKILSIEAPKESDESQILVLKKPDATTGRYNRMLQPDATATRSLRQCLILHMHSRAFYTFCEKKNDKGNE